jgi:hypothetical protein
MNNNKTLFKLELTEELFLRLGSTWIIDSIYLFVIPPFSIIGFFLNLSFLFALDSFVGSDKAKLYKYLMVYSFNSSILCLLHVFTFLTLSPRYFQHSFLYFTKFYRCKILSYFSICLCLFGNILDIMIALDRLCTFLNERFYDFNSAKPYTKCFAFFILSLIINIPILYSLKIMENDELFNDNAVYFCGQTDFARSKIGIIINIILVVFRDILTLIIEIVLTSLSLFYYKKYRLKSIEKYYTIATKSLHVNFKKKKRSKGKKLLLMSIYLSLMSIVLHLIICTVMFMVASVILEDLQQCAIYILILVISVVAKNVFNVFICFHFNSQFKKQFKLSNLFSRGSSK